MKNQKLCSHSGQHRNGPFDACLSYFTLFSLSCGEKGLETMSEGRGRFSKPPVNKLWESPGRRLAGQRLCIPREEFQSLGRYVPDNPQGKFDPLKFLVVSAAAEFFTPPRVEGPIHWHSGGLQLASLQWDNLQASHTRLYEARTRLISQQQQAQYSSKKQEEEYTFKKVLQ